MSNPSLDPVGAFDQSFPRSVQRDMLRVLLDAYRRARRATEELVDEPEIDDLWRDVRRGIIEGAVRSVAKKHGLTARIETNRSGNNHTVIEGGNFFLTISAVGDPSDSIRPAQFREAATSTFFVNVSTRMLSRRKSP